MTHLVIPGGARGQSIHILNAANAANGAHTTHTAHAAHGTPMAMPGW